MNIVDSERIPIKMWLSDLEESAFRQAKNLANLPFAFKHVALMPDAHCGYGMPIGGVLATRGVIIPNAVGVDIGCGMCAVRTSLTDIARNTVKTIIKDIRASIPVGFNHRKSPERERMPDMQFTHGIVEREFSSATRQIGTLGGGNHFIEIQKGSDGHIWLMIHSGSRNIGKQVAEHYNHIAKRLASAMKWPVPKEVDLAYLMCESREGEAYFAEMNYCLQFAKANRDFMMEIVKGIVCEHIGCTFEHYINIHHNYAKEEEHFGRRVMVHRKGATSAYKGEEGIIPGSQGTKSYLVVGKGCEESFKSCSHGAGRVMSRRQACRVLSLSGEIKKLNDAGVIHGMRHKRDLDEASSAYKDIDHVMQEQTDLASIVVSLTPLGVVKG